MDPDCYTSVMPEVETPRRVPSKRYNVAGVTGVLRVPNPASPKPRLTIRLRDGSEFKISQEDLEGVAEIAFQCRRESPAMTDLARLMLNHPTVLSADGISFQPFEEPGQSAGTARQLIIAGADPEAQATPVLTWQRASSNQRSGWRLTLQGHRAITIGFAAWNDPDGIRGLIAQMADPESAMIVAGLISPDETSYLASLIAVEGILRTRSVRRVALAPIRKAFAEHGLAGHAQGAERNQCGRLRLLTITVGDRSFPVAAAIMAPASPADAEQKYVQWFGQHRGAAYAERNEVKRRLQVEGRSEWIDKARQAVVSAGWRLLDLPTPHRGWGDQLSPVIWATPIPEQQWSELDRAARQEASRLVMERGSPI